MISFISKIKNLSTTAESILVRKQKSKTLGSRFCTAFPRTLCENNYLISNALICKQNNDSCNRKNYHHSKNIPRNFGKIVELDENFNSIETKEESNECSKGNERGTQFELLVPCETEEEIEDETLEKKLFNGERKYSSVKKNEALFSSILSKIKSKKQREKHQEFLLHGKRLIHEAITSGILPIKIFYTRNSDLIDLNLPAETKVFRISYNAFQLWADTVTPPGITGIFKIPNLNKMERSTDIPLTVICDNVRDPGNMGAILRIVSAAGCEQLILTKGCTDIWEQKVLRASAGAHFHLPVLRNMVWTDIENEIGETSQVFLADCHDELESTERENSIFTKLGKGSELLPRSSYFSLQFEKKSSVLIIGGETHGLSDDAFTFAIKRNGTRVFIPISNNIESLNNSVALGILVFEFKRQFNSISENTSSHLKSDSSQFAESGSEVS